jgi:hypothetical protein
VQALFLRSAGYAIRQLKTPKSIAFFSLLEDLPYLLAYELVARRRQGQTYNTSLNTSTL